MKSLLLTGENNLINRPVFAGFYRSEIVFQPAGDRPDRCSLKFGPAGPDRFKNIRPVTTLTSMYSHVLRVLHVLHVLHVLRVLRVLPLYSRVLPCTSPWTPMYSRGLPCTPRTPCTPCTPCTSCTPGVREYAVSPLARLLREI